MVFKTHQVKHFTVSSHALSTFQLAQVGMCQWCYQ